MPTRPFHSCLEITASHRRFSASVVMLIGLLSCVMGVLQVQGQGIRGRVIDENGDPLSFVTIFIRETGSGTTSNVNGRYEIPLEAGEYQIDFRHLGHRSALESASIQNDWIDRDVVLARQAYTLSAAEIHAGNEDPAYPIIRKAIAKSGYFRNQVDGYTCRVYLKGSGRLVDYPWYAAPMIKKEGIDTSAAYTTESVTEVSYRRPNSYEEKVIYFRATGEDPDVDPINYINGSFYEDRIAGFPSPLSKKAFAYYKYEYVNTFKDGDYQIEKIRVIPRLKDEGLFSGDLYIVDGLWNIHSVRFTIETQGIVLHVEQNMAPIVEDVWLPVSHRYYGTGSMMGFDFEFNYLASVSDYRVDVNEELQARFTVVDAETVDTAPTTDSGDTAQTKVVPYDTLTTRQLRKRMRQYAREERKSREEPLLISERKTSIDSAAATAAPEFWNRIRPVPLTPAEVKGYQLADSLALTDTEGADSSQAKTGFGVLDLFVGDEYRWKRGQRFKIHNPLVSLRFNTVDGFNGRYRLTYEKTWLNKNSLSISPTFRYAHSRDKGTGFVNATYTAGDVLHRTTISAEGGSFFRQFNRDRPISTFTNAISSLFAENNFMKIYDRKYGQLDVSRRQGARFGFGARLEYNRREQTFNTTDQVWIDIDGKSYTPNAPKNIEVDDTGFGVNEAFLVEGRLSFYPTDRYGKTNGKIRLYPSGTEFNLTYRKAIPGVAHAATDFDFLSLEAKHTFGLGIWGRLRARTEGGKFFTQGHTPFMDYAHFMGNQTIFTRFHYMGSYSIMPYYKFSTNDEYWSTYVNLKLNRFALTQFTALRSIGLSEHIIVNHLLTPSVQNYVELGYSVGNIFRLFRIDVTAAFLDGRYSDFRVQLGITSELFQFDF